MKEIISLKGTSERHFDVFLPSEFWRFSLSSNFSTVRRIQILKPGQQICEMLRIGIARIRLIAFFLVLRSSRRSGWSSSLLFISSRSFFPTAFWHEIFQYLEVGLFHHRKLNKSKSRNPPLIDESRIWFEVWWFSASTLSEVIDEDDGSSFTEPTSVSFSSEESKQVKMSHVRSPFLLFKFYQEINRCLTK